MSLTKEQLESAREAGAVIIANERQHGRPDEWHPVGDFEKAPKYSCEERDYAVVWLEGVNDERTWAPPASAAVDYRRAVLDAAERAGVKTPGKSPEEIVALLVGRPYDAMGDV